MQGLSLSPRRDAPARTSVVFFSAEKTTRASSEASAAAYEAGRFIFRLVFAGMMALILAVLYVILSTAGVLAAEAVSVPGSETAGALKTLTTEHGLLGTLLGLALLAVTTLFWLLMKAGTSRETALALQEAVHAKELKEKEASHSADRAEWYAQITLLQEARVGQLREVLVGLNNSTAMLQNVQQIIAERSHTSAEMTSKVSEVVATLTSLRNSQSEDTAAMRKAIVALTDEIEAIRRQVRPS